jgi:hypothetical protein
VAFDGFFPLLSLFPLQPVTLRQLFRIDVNELALDGDAADQREKDAKQNDAITMRAPPSLPFSNC